MEIKERELLVNTERLTIIEQMEKDWPNMTQEFKKIQREQYVLFLHIIGPSTNPTRNNKLDDLF